MNIVEATWLEHAFLVANWKQFVCGEKEGGLSLE